MSPLLYKPKEEQVVSVEIEQKDGKLFMTFYSDGGKFGTTETLDEYEITPKALLDILQALDYN